MELILQGKVVIEVVGYLGCIFVLTSFLLKDIKWIRIINIVGAIFFIIYGINTNTWSTALTNVMLVIVHIIFLVRMYLAKRQELKKIEN